MKEQKEQVSKKIKYVFKNFGLSIGVSWKSSKLLFLTRVFFEILTAIVPIALAYIMKTIINMLSSRFFGQAGFNQNILLQVFILYLALQITSAFITKLKTILGNIHQEIINNHIDLLIIDKVNSLDISFFDSPKFYDDMIRATEDSHSLQLLTWVSVSFISGMVQSASCFFIMWRLKWYIPFLIILLTLPSMIIEKIYIKRSYVWDRKRVKSERKINYYKDVLKSKQFAKDIRVLNLYPTFYKGLVKLWKSWFSEKKKIIFERGLWGALANSLPQIGTTIILFYVGLLILQRKLTIGDFTFYSGMIGQFVAGIAGVFGAFTQIYESELKLTNYRIFLNLIPKIKKQGNLIPKSNLEIEFRNVYFTYPTSDRQILNNVSFKINSCEKVALVGLNGAGKSTIIKLILRLYDPTDGEILVNGINIKDYDICEYRKNFGVVFQDFVNYSFSLRDSIAISDIDKKSDDRKIYYACKAAGIENVVKRLSKGLNTYLTKQFDDSGEELSGGEWQKVSIARAYFKDSKFMIMDEPSAALDPEAEYSMFETLANLCENKGTLIISHRLSSVVMADRIIVLEKGRLVESGSHSELLHKNGRYAQLFNLQAERYITKV